MLKNIGEKITIKFNGILKPVEKDGLLDVRDFDVTTGQTKPMNEVIPIIEKRLFNKYPGQFKIVPTIDDAKIEAKYTDEILSLKKKIEELNVEIEKVSYVNKKNEQIISTQAEEINGFGPKEKGLRDQIASLKAQLKEQEEDSEAMIARLGGRKTK